MRELEAAIGAQLKSSDTVKVKDGLSNVLYWGYYNDGRRDYKVKRFRSKVTEEQLGCGIQIFNDVCGPGLTEIRDWILPIFSNMSFISKLRMFLDPTRYVTLDLKLAEIAT